MKIFLKNFLSTEYLPGNHQLFIKKNSLRLLQKFLINTELFLKKAGKFIKIYSLSIKVKNQNMNLTTQKIFSKNLKNKNLSSHLLRFKNLCSAFIKIIPKKIFFGCYKTERFFYTFKDISRKKAEINENV